MWMAIDCGELRAVLKARRSGTPHGEIDDDRLLPIEPPEAELVVEIEEGEERTMAGSSGSSWRSAS
jgi:hypothetical protein